MKQKIFLASVFLVLSLVLPFSFPGKANAVDSYSQTINLEPGWNVISTPRVLESYVFSVPETIENFAILVLNSAGEWATMQDVGQDTFVPLYGYFINNKTGSTQTLTLNYRQDLDPSQRLFDRELTAGWNIVGIANPSYALNQYDGVDSDNAVSVLGDTKNCLATVGDFTFGNTDNSSVYAGNIWNFRNSNDLNTLNNWRETKAYGVYVSSTCDYLGFQNNDPVVLSTSALVVTQKDTQPSDSEIVSGATDSISLVANIFADETASADGIKINWEGTGTASSFENAKVYLNSSLIATFDPDTNSGTTEIIAPATFNKNNNELKITVDSKSSAVVGNRIRFGVQGGKANTNELFYGQNPIFVSSSVPVSNITGSSTGAWITVIEGAALSVSRTDGYSVDRKIIMGNADVILGEFSVTAENDDITLTSIEVAANSGTGIQVDDASVYDMKIKINGEVVGSTRDFTASGAVFSGLNIPISKDTTKTIEILASFDISSTGSIKTVLSFYNQDSVARELTTQTDTTVNQIVSESGTLTAVVDPNTRDASIILAKPSVEQEVASFRFTTEDDFANITEVTIMNSSSKASDDSVSSIKLYKGATLIGTDYVLGNSTTIHITSNELIVAADSSQTITVKVVLNEITNVSQSSSTFRALLTGLKYKGTPGDEITSSTSVSGNLMQIRKTMPTLAAVSLGATGSQQTQEEVLKFTVTADANEDVYITSLTVVEVGTATSSVSHFKLYEGSTEKKDITSGLVFDMSATPLVIGKGTTKTYTVKADTSGVAVDATYGLSLEKGSGSNNILWAEYFVAGNNPGNAEYIFTLPIANTKKY